MVRSFLVIVNYISLLNINESIIYDMPTAYILVFCELGCEAPVVDELRTLPSVVEAVFSIIKKIYGPLPPNM